MDKRKIGIGVAIAAGLVLLFFVGKWFIGPKDGKKSPIGLSPEEKEERATEKALLSLNQLCRYADSVGIDTTRYSAASTSQLATIDKKRADLLMEVRYGKKPSRLAFSGLKEDVDSTWADKADVAGNPKELAKLASFAPYTQLVGHYNRLRKRGGSPALADSLRLIRQTLNFYRYINRFDPDQFVLVNIPAGELNVFDRTGKRLLPMQVIAGKPDKMTPCMATYIQDIVMYPYWNVPKNIALEEMLPRMKRNIAYIYNQNLQILDAKDHEVDPEDINWEELSETNFPYRVRQASGCENSLGLLKFNLANPLAIYLHDTNSRDLFKNTTDRWRSHGCVRVQKPVELANLVLGTPTFDAAFMNKCLIDQKPQNVAHSKALPRIYRLQRGGRRLNGKLRFYNDVYSLDK